jgi:hypothetical protein
MIETLMAADFYKDKNIFEYAYNWKSDVCKITRNSDILHKYTNQYEDNIFIKFILNKFGLIDLAHVQSFNPESVNYLIQKCYSSTNEYEKFRDLLISIVNSGNALNYKYYVSGPGLLVWDNEDKIIFFEPSWLVFIHSLFTSFNMNIQSTDNSNRSVQIRR